MMQAIQQSDTKDTYMTSKGDIDIMLGSA